MRRTRPNVTGIAVGLAVAAWIATREGEPGPRKAARCIFSGIGIAVLLTHIFQRLDESLDSRNQYRAAKSKYLGALADSVEPGQRTSRENRRPTNSDAEPLDWLSAAPETAIHWNDEPFDTGTSADTVRIAPDSSATDDGPYEPGLSFESAMADGNWIEACKALASAREKGTDFEPEPEVLDRLRKSAMEDIFHRMHSGTVREDVAILAKAVSDIFPDSTEGRTLAQVLGVLRRSAGLCPRCAKPYRGIASACHDCLRGTPEAYQIAWDDDAEASASNG